MKKELIILLHGPLTKNEFANFGIDYLRKNFNVSIFDISQLVKSTYYQYKKIYRFPIIKTFEELDTIFSKKENAMCWEVGFSINSFRIYKLIRRNNLKTISIDGICSIPSSKEHKERVGLIHRFNKRLKVFLFNPSIFIKRISFYIGAKIRDWRYKKTDIVILGGKASNLFPGYSGAQHKIVSSSFDYGNYLIQKKKKKFKNKKNFAVFIDTYLLFHPEHAETTNLLYDRKKYFKSLINFFNIFQKETNLEVIIALYPKANIKKYPKEFKKFKMISGKTLKLVEASKIVLHQGSTAQSFAVICKKPTIFLTSNEMEKYKYIHDHGEKVKFMGSKVLNVDNIDYKILKSKKLLFHYNKNLYKKYFFDYLKHPASNNLPWYKNFGNYFNNKKFI